MSTVPAPLKDGRLSSAPALSGLRAGSADPAASSGFDAAWRRPVVGATAFGRHPACLLANGQFAWPAAAALARRQPAPAPPPAVEIAREPEVPAAVARPALHPLFDPGVLFAPPAVVAAPPTPTAVRRFRSLYRVPGSLAAPPQPLRRPSRPAFAVGSAAVAAAVFGAVILSGMLSAPPVFRADFTAPILVMRAAAAGQVASVPVAVGQVVEPGTKLITLHDDQPAGTADKPVFAAVHGIVLSLTARPGTHHRAGEPLMRVADCAHAFLVPQDSGTALAAGQTVVVRVPGLRPFHGTMRPAVGWAEPAGLLVVDPDGLADAAPGGCPVDTAAEIQPDGHR